MIQETKIIQDCLNGDIEGFGLLVRKYQNSLLSTAYRFLGNWDDARDAAQDAFVKAYRSLSRFNQARRFSPWLHRILVNVCLDRLKSAYRRYRSSLNAEMNEETTSNPLSMLAEDELFQKALSQLSSKKRRAFTLVDLEGFSGPEAAEILGCSESTVRVTVMKARQQLRKTYIELNAL